MAETWQRRLLLILLALVTNIDSVSQRVSIPGTATFWLLDGTVCNNADHQDDKQDFETHLASRLPGVDAQYITVKRVACDTSGERDTLLFQFEILLPPDIGPSDVDLIDLMRGFRDNEEEKEILFLALKDSHAIAEKVEFEMAMWKCPDATLNNCKSLTGATGNFVWFTLGVNASTIAPTETTTTAPKVECQFAMLWLAEDLDETIPCGAQAGITFGGFGALVIFCPLLGWMCHVRAKRVFVNVCGLMDPEHLGTGFEVHHKYWWTETAPTATDLVGIDPPETDSMLTREQVRLLLAERRLHENHDNPEELAKRHEARKAGSYVAEPNHHVGKKQSVTDGSPQDVEAAPVDDGSPNTLARIFANAEDGIATVGDGIDDEGEGGPLDRLLMSLLEQGYIVDIDPNAPPPSDEVSQDRDSMGNNNNSSGGVKAASLYERAVVQRGAEPWDDSHIGTCGTPAYENGTEVEFYSTRNYCWSIAYLHVFVWDPATNPKFKKRASANSGGKIVYGVEIETGQDNGLTPFRYNIGCEHLRVPIVKGELVEVYDNGHWVRAAVEGPRLTYRQNIAHGAFRQQIGYNLMGIESHQLFRMVPAERVRRCFNPDMEVDYYDGPENGWVLGIVRNSIIDEAEDELRANPFQPWANLSGHHRRSGSHGNQRQSSAGSNPGDNPNEVSSRQSARQSNVAGNNHTIGGPSSWTVVAAKNPDDARVNIWKAVQIAESSDSSASLGNIVPSYKIRNRMDDKRRLSWL